MQRRMLQNTTKISLLAAEMVWIIFGITGIQHAVHAAWGIHTFLDQTVNTAAIVGDKLTWKDADFKTAQKETAKLYKQSEVMQRNDGFTIYTPNTNTNLVIMPKKYAKELTLWTHRRMCHTGAAKVAAELRRSYH